MCFNETASLVALAIGVTFSAILLLKGEVAYGGSLFFIAIIQFYEYLAHVSINTNNDGLNALATNLIFFGVALQPLVFAFFNTFFMPKGAKFGLGDGVRKWPVIAVYLAITGWAWYTSRNYMRTTHIDKENCSAVCRLNWFNNAPVFPLVVFLIIYCLVIWAFFVRDSRLQFPKAVPVPEALPVLLIVSLVYTFVLDMGWRLKFGYLGSIWCFLSVFSGPLYLFHR